MKKSLLDLKVGKQGIIKSISLDEKTKMRLLNLGVYPNEKIECLFSGPFKDPRAYLVKGTTFALRNSDALYIEVITSE